MQVNALKDAGCIKIFSDDGVSGAATERQGLYAALEYAKSGDILVVWKLDRLARSLSYLCNIMSEMDDKNIGFISLTDSINTTRYNTFIFY